MLGLPSGQDVAEAMKIKNPLTADEIASGPGRRRSRSSTACTRTRRSGTTSSRRRRSATAASASAPSARRIVAEVFVGLVARRHESYLWQAKNWKPTLPAKMPGTFTMTDLLQFVGDISPIDGITPSIRSDGRAAAPSR